ncbi:polyprenol phosphomannose-dependent alpha 1,6 mannosyltransferase MptB [Amycolatopsis xylanica]|uniref:polyprenol phosphomannose-dependent alpha 1,6 mannosyltransferase MptB n=1 Tax=Amycolatopsis xylanica TaxID=589385 RepID=UPI00115F9E66|nr:polyprenol phosphomannose-dependent alpha 1,6 mannosyltransferase MptB [Amycolatopsis xylanica]
MKQVQWVGFAGAVLLTAAALAGKFLTLPGGAAAAVLAAGVAGVGLVVLAWAFAGRILLTGDAGAGWPRRTLVLWGAPLLAAPPLFSSDVYSYLAQGEIAARGLDVYSVGPRAGLGAASAITGRVSEYWQDAPSPYGPVFSAVERWIAGVAGENPVLGVLGYRLAAVAGLAMAVWAVPRLARLAGVSEGVALWLGVLNPLVLWHFLGGAHNDALMAGLMLAGTACALTAIGESLDSVRLGAGVLLICLGALVKFPAIVALAVVGVALLRRRGATYPRLAGMGAAAAGVFVLVAVVVSGLSDLGFGWLRTMTTSGSVNSWMAPTNWFGFLTGPLGPGTQTMIGVGKIIGYVFIAVLSVLLVQRQLKGQIGPVTALGALLAVVAVLGPVIQPWYLLWAVIPLACAVDVHRGRIALAGLSVVFAVVIPPLAGNFSGRIVQLVIGYVGGLAVVAATALIMRKTETTPSARISSH